MHNQRRTTAIADKKKKSIIFMTIAVLVSIYLSIILIFGDKGLLSYYDRKMTIIKVQAEIQTLSRQKEKIKKEIDMMENERNSSLLESEARAFGLILPGELVYKFKNEESGNSDYSGKSDEKKN